LKSNAQEALVKIIDASGRAKFAMRLPFFTAYLISKTDNPRQCVDLALQLRDDAAFRDCRTIFNNLAHLSVQDRYKEVNSILGFLEQSCSSLIKKYGVSTDGGLQSSVSLGLSGIGISTSVKLNKLFRHYRNRPFARVFRNISQDMLNVERLGSLHDKLCSSIREHKDATYPKVSVTPKFMERKENEHGRPAKL
jgi:hypothetical protein